MTTFETLVLPLWVVVALVIFWLWCFILFIWSALEKRFAPKQKNFLPDEEAEENLGDKPMQEHIHSNAIVDADGEITWYNDNCK